MTGTAAALSSVSGDCDLGVLAFPFGIMISSFRHHDQQATRMTNSDQFRVPERVNLLLESAEVALC
jgi:hypothetical protein